MVFHIFIFIFLVRTNGKKEHLDANDFHHSYGNYFESAIMKVTWYQLCSKFFLNIYKGHWQWHLKDTLQLKTLQQCNNIRTNSSWQISWNKNGRRCLENYQLYKSLSLLYEEHFTYYCILLFFSKNLVFKFNLILIQ